MDEAYKYPGEELALFQHATHWKKYFSRQVRPYIKGKVLEAGAGMGATTLLLNDGSAEEWWLTEPDAQLSSLLEEKLRNKLLPGNCHLLKQGGNDPALLFDTIVYIDVLEHIEADREELMQAASRLNENGHIIVLSPAYQALYSPFDKAIGHYRRYTRNMLKAISPPGLQLVHCRYYDSMGYFASLLNKTMLKQKMPTLKQVLFWDNWLLPVSKVTDKLFFHRFGKSIIAAWRK